MFHTKYLVNWVVWRQSTIEDRELALESLRNVVAATAGLDHGCDELDVHDVREVSGLLQVIHATHLHHLARDLIGYLAGAEYQEWATHYTAYWNDHV